MFVPLEVIRMSLIPLHERLRFGPEELYQGPKVSSIGDACLKPRTERYDLIRRSC